MYGWPRISKSMVSVAAMLLLLFLLACGAAATGTPVIKEVVREVVKEVPVDVPREVEKEVVKEVVKEVEKLVVATPTPAARPARVVQLGSVNAAVLETRAGSGMPMFCPAGCAETVYQIGIAETLFMSDWEDETTRQTIVLKPRLATSWEYESSFPPKWVDFKIQKGVKFHNGMDMTAEDVAWSFDNANGRTNPDSIHGQAGDLAGLIDHVEVLDDETIRMHYYAFDSRGVLHRFSTYWQSIGIYSKQLYDQYVAKFGAVEAGEKMRDDHVATGPYRLLEWQPNTRIVVEAVPEHWREPATVKTVRLLEVPEKAARRAGLETGEWQIAGELDTKDLIALRDKGYRIEDRNGLIRQFALYFTGNLWEKNHVITGEPLELPGLKAALENNIPWVGDPDDPDSMERARKVRWALAMTIPQEEIFENLLLGIGEVQEIGYISSNSPFWQDKWEVPFDPVKAKQYMQEAGYPNGFDISIWVGPSGIVPEAGKVIAGSWLTHLNVKALLNQVIYSQYRPGLVARSTYDPWISTADDGRNVFPFHFAKGAPTSSYTRGGFSAGIETPLSAELMMKMSLEPDPQKRIPLAEKYFDDMHYWMLMPGVAGVPWVLMSDPKAICDWKPWPGANSNISGFASAESLRLC